MTHLLASVVLVGLILLAHLLAIAWCIATDEKHMENWRN